MLLQSCVPWALADKCTGEEKQCVGQYALYTLDYCQTQVQEKTVEACAAGGWYFSCMFRVFCASGGRNDSARRSNAREVMGFLFAGAPRRRPSARAVMKSATLPRALACITWCHPPWSRALWCCFSVSALHDFFGSPFPLSSVFFLLVARGWGLSATSAQPVVRRTGTEAAMIRKPHSRSRSTLAASLASSLREIIKTPYR